MPSLGAAPPKSRTPRAQHGQLRVRLEARGLRAQALGVADVVGVHAREERGARRRGRPR